MIIFRDKDVQKIDLLSKLKKKKIKQKQKQVTTPPDQFISSQLYPQIKDQCTLSSLLF